MRLFPDAHCPTFQGIKGHQHTRRRWEVYRVTRNESQDRKLRDRPLWRSQSQESSWLGQTDSHAHQGEGKGPT